MCFEGPGDNKKLNRTAVTNISHYRELFGPANGKKAVGEASPLYMYYPEVPERIQQQIPDVKLIIILRNPVDRAYSSYLHLLRDGRESLSFEEALNAEEHRISQNWTPLWFYRSLGFYSVQIKRYYQKFTREQIKLFLYEDFSTSPMRLLQDIYCFLNIDPQFQPDLSQVHNVSGVPQNRELHEFLTKPNGLKTIIRYTLPPKLRSYVQTKLAQLRNRNLNKPTLAIETRHYLQEYFREDILETQDLIERDLTTWLKT
ncbi:MAG: sulfotransferase [Caldilineaceae bacterium]